MKSWLIKIGVMKLGPSAIRAIIAGLVGLLAAHAGLLESLGIMYDKTTNIISIHLNSLSAWLSVTGLGLVTAALRAAQHHGGVDKKLEEKMEPQITQSQEEGKQ